MSNRYKIFLTLLYFLTVILSSSAQGVNSSKSKIVECFLEYYKHGIDEKLYIQTDKPYLYSAADTVWFKGYLVNAITHAPLNITNYIYVQFVDSDGYLSDEVKVKRQPGSGFSGYIPLSAKLTPGDYSIRAYTKWMTGGDQELFFEKRLKIVSPVKAYLPKSAQEQEQQRRRRRQDNKKPKTLDFDMQFFPEGGVLTAGTMQNIAFKAQAEDGLSIEVRGSVYDSEENRICNFETTHLGMGNFTLNVPHDSQYYVRATSSQGLSKRFKLPRADIESIGLSVTQVGDYVYYKPVSGFPLAVSYLRAIIHSRGRIISVNDGDLRKVHRIPLRNLYSGVNVISLVDRKGNLVAERIFFKSPTRLPKIDILPDKKNYDARQKVKLSLNVRDSHGAAAQGEFAISVVDDGVVAKDSTTDNVLSYLLLSSEISGHIEKPALYFADSTRQTRHNLDLLMMTQGWRRFDVSKIIDPQADHTRSVMYEDIVSISGKVKGFFGNKARGAMISVFSEELPFFNVYYLDSTHIFNIKDLDIPERTNFTFRAKSKLHSQYLTLKLDKEELPISRPAIFSRKQEAEPLSFINQSMEQFFYSGDMRIIELQTVNVESQRADTAGYLNKPIHVATREELKQYRKKKFSHLLHSYADMDIQNDTVYYNGGTRAVRFMVNGIHRSCHDVALLTLDMIESAEFREQYVMQDKYDASSGTDSGIFYITLVAGAIMPSMEDMANTVIYSPLGYQQARVFYHPTYDSPPNPDDVMRDFRTTLFWSAEVTPDEDGNATVEFYAADKATTYRVTVEGVTTTGEACHGEALIQRY